MPYRGAVAVTHRRKPKVRRRGVLTKAIVRLTKAIPPLRVLVPDASRQACLREFTVDILHSINCLEHKPDDKAHRFRNLRDFGFIGRVCSLKDAA